MQLPTFFWYDLETFGTSSRADRIAQFAGIRTTMDLEPVGDPIVTYCQPDPDYLPAPQACAVHGITPQEALAKGLIEPEFAAEILAELGTPETCTAGYNNLRFDDEFIRFLLYRNFFEPFEREYRDGNSRSDLIDLVRMAYALRPQGIEWPEREDGGPSFRLEDLAAANAICHTDAHDALSDVEATLGLARLLKSKQPRLFEHGLRLRNKRFAADQLQLVSGDPVVHVSSRFAAQRGCLAVVMAICPHPQNSNGVIVYDLSEDPSDLAHLDVDAISERVFTPQRDLSDARIPLKTVQVNRSPMLAPIGVLRDADHDRIELNLDACLHHQRILKSIPDLAMKIAQVFEPRTDIPAIDDEEALYAGGFLPDADRHLLAEVRATPPNEFRPWLARLQDARLKTLLRRRVARHCEDSLTAEERRDWILDVQRRVFESGQLAAFTEELEALDESPLRTDLGAWKETLCRKFDLQEVSAG